MVKSKDVFEFVIANLMFYEIALKEQNHAKLLLPSSVEVISYSSRHLGGSFKLCFIVLLNFLV